MNKTFPASLDQLYDMLHFIREQASASQLNEEQVSKIELALEEALVNIISYGYPERSGNIEIECLFPLAAGLKIVIKDQGISYNPLTNVKNFEHTAPVEQRDLGGYGIYLMLRIMDEVHYKREGNYNILTLTKFRVK